jgi:hypothetical protein
MKVGVAVICLALTLAFSLPGHSAVRLRAHYEVNVRDTTDTKTVRAASDVIAGAPMRYEFEKYTLVVQIDVPASDSYVLTVWLDSITNPKKAILKAVFNGRLGGSDQGPMQFTTSQDGVTVSGAISLVSIDH